jgi:hypothetical protein
MAKLQDPSSVARPGEVELVKSTLLNPGLRTRNKTAEQQMRNFMKTVETRANDAYSIRGMKAPNPLSHLSGPERTYAEWAVKNPNDPRAKLVLEKLNVPQ